MYASRKINNDPKPYSCKSCDLRVADAEFCDHGGTIYAPRPEYGNSPNRLLVNFRAIDAGRREYADWLRDLDEHPHVWRGVGMFSTDEIEHARKVFARLAAL